MEAAKIQVVRRPERLLSDDKRVITRHLDFRSPKRIRSALKRIARLHDDQIPALLEQSRERFWARYRELEVAFLENATHASDPNAVELEYPLPWVQPSTTSIAEWLSNLARMLNRSRTRTVRFDRSQPNVPPASLGIQAVR